MYKLIAASLICALAILIPGCQAQPRRSALSSDSLFTPAANSPYAVAPRPYYVAVGDVTGDGKPDLVTTHDDIN